MCSSALPAPRPISPSAAPPSANRSILVNGLRLNDVQTGHNNLDLPFPFAAVERIEVLKGAGSTLYGSDAMGGAVNFITAIPRTMSFV